MRNPLSAFRQWLTRETQYDIEFYARRLRLTTTELMRGIVETSTNQHLSATLAAVFASRMNRCTDVEEVRRFKDEGADFNTTDNWGNTALHIAADKRMPVALLQALIFDGDADPFMKNNAGQTPLDVSRVSHDSLKRTCGHFWTLAPDDISPFLSAFMEGRDIASCIGDNDQGPTAAKTNKRL